MSRTPEQAEAERVVRELHASVTLVTSVRPDGDAYAWVATLTGEDFLDGPWSVTRDGTSRSQGRALRDAAKAFEPRHITALARLRRWAR